MSIVKLCFFFSIHIWNWIYVCSLFELTFFGKPGNRVSASKHLEWVKNRRMKKKCYVVWFCECLKSRIILVKKTSVYNLCQMEEQNKECLIQISKFKFSLVISGLTKILQRVNESVSLTDFYKYHQAQETNKEINVIMPISNREHMVLTMRKIIMNHCLLLIRHFREMPKWPTKRYNKIWWSNEC